MASGTLYVLAVSSCSCSCQYHRAEFTTNPPLAGAFNPKKGDLCAAKFVDDQWYRARVEKMGTVRHCSICPRIQLVNVYVYCQY